VATRRKIKHRAPTYIVKKLEGVIHADTIAALFAGDGWGDAGTRATTFIGVTWWGAFEKGHEEDLVGVAGMCHSAIEEGTFYLNRSYVVPEHRGRGLQKKLIMARVARARELGGTAVTSDTYNNPPSTNNLIACGFRAYAPKDPWRGDGTVYWRLVLK
jgi:GNAT superfamily N-acetyltransferase